MRACKSEELSPVDDCWGNLPTIKIQLELRFEYFASFSSSSNSNYMFNADFNWQAQPKLLISLCLKSELAVISLNPDMWRKILQICGGRSCRYVEADPGDMRR